MRRVFVLLVLACGDVNQKPTAAASLWADVQRSSYATTMPPVPGYETTKPASADSPHGDAIKIYMNPVVAAVVTPVSGKLSAWPDGSMFVLDSFNTTSGAITLTNIMKKDGSAWFFAQYEVDGTVNSSGAPKECTECHSMGADFVRSLPLP